jgi:hypothetical protein
MCLAQIGGHGVGVIKISQRRLWPSCAGIQNGLPRFGEGGFGFVVKVGPWEGV